MPTFAITTNREVKEPLTFVKDLSKLASKLTGRPEAQHEIRLMYEPYMIVGGSDEPAFSVQIFIRFAEDMGKFNEQIITGLTPFLEERLNVANDRGIIAIVALGPEYFGFKGKPTSYFLQKTEI